MPAARTILLCSSFPTALFATTAEGGADPRPMLLWYAALAVPALVSLIVGVLSIVDFFGRRSQAAKAESLGGYVTHPQLNAELGKVYDTVKLAVKDAMKDVKGLIEKLDHEIDAVRTTATAAAVDIAQLEGRMDAGAGKRPR